MFGKVNFQLFFGEDRFNDLLVVFGLPGVEILDFNIYDRWGGLVYKPEVLSLNDRSVGWDGTFKGKELDSGTYIWTARIKQLNGVEIDIKGDVTLIR